MSSDRSVRRLAESAPAPALVPAPHLKTWPAARGRWILFGLFAASGFASLIQHPKLVLVSRSEAIQ